MQVTRALDAVTLKKLYRFRHEVYVEQLQWLQAQKEGLLVDEFDVCAHNYAALNDSGECIGSVRVVFDGPLGLPIERSFPLNGYRCGRRIAEICRLATADAYNNTRLGPLLMKAAYQCCIYKCISNIVVDAYMRRHKSVGLYDKMGFRPIGAPYRDRYHDEKGLSLALELDVEHAQRTWPSDRAGLYKFFTRIDKAISHE